MERAGWAPSSKSADQAVIRSHVMKKSSFRKFIIDRCDKFCLCPEDSIREKRVDT